MPELPEVETMRRGVQGVQGGTIVRMEIVRNGLRPIQIEPAPSALRRRIYGKRVTHVGRIGKRVVWHLERGGNLIFEPRMTGLLSVTEPPSVAHVRMRLALIGSPIRHVCYWDRRGLGRVYWLSDQGLGVQLGPRQVGPDALEVSTQDLRDRFANSTRPIKVALLDQKAIAGIGNLYAAEILHRSRIDPRRSCRQLSHEDWRQLHLALRHVLTKAIRYEGSTLADGTYRTSLNQNGSYQNHHRVYGKAGDLCPTCRRAQIQRIVQAQRSTFFCPNCQTRKRRVL